MVYFLRVELRGQSVGDSKGLPPMTDLANNSGGTPLTHKEMMEMWEFSLGMRDFHDGVPIPKCIIDHLSKRMPYGKSVVYQTVYKKGRQYGAASGKKFLGMIRAGSPDLTLYTKLREEKVIL
jgi:hypothetical protein